MPTLPRLAPPSHALLRLLTPAHAFAFGTQTNLLPVRGGMAEPRRALEVVGLALVVVVCTRAGALNPRDSLLPSLLLPAPHALTLPPLDPLRGKVCTNSGVGVGLAWLYGKHRGPETLEWLPTRFMLLAPAR